MGANYTTVCMFVLYSFFGWRKTCFFFLFDPYLFLILEMLMIWLQEILEARENEKFHIWSFRMREEAASNSKELFGHLDEVE